MASIPVDSMEPDVEWQQRHSAVTRLTHWVRVVALACLMMSGLQIFNAYPRLHWGNIGSDHDSAWLEIGAMNGRGMVRAGNLEIDTTGLLGLSRQDGATEMKAFPGWATLPATRDLASARRWHFFWAWVFVINGLIYLAVEFASGRFRLRMFPSRDELAPAHLMNEIVSHAGLKFPKGEGARTYNVLQKIAYLAVLLGLLPLMVLTGLTMSPSFSATLPLAELFGGRQSARSLHFITMWLLVGFVLLHVGLVMLAGAWNLLRSMVTGRFAIRKGVY